MQSTNAARILSICDDLRLAWSRELVLKKDGFEIESFDSESVLTNCDGKSFDVALLCHGIGEDGRKRTLIDDLRRRFPNIQIVGLIRFAGKADPAWDSGCRIEDGPAGLIEAVRSASHRGHGSKGINNSDQ